MSFPLPAMDIALLPRRRRFFRAIALTLKGRPILPLSIAPWSTHDQLRQGANAQVYGGWPLVLSGLKTLLETGETLTTPGSLRWMQTAAAASRIGRG
jgi:hypothetical protein